MAAARDSGLHLELLFGAIADFGPDRVATQVEPLRKLLDLRKKLAELHGLRRETVHEDAIMRVLAAELLKNQESLPEEQRAKIDAKVAEIDAVLSAQLNEILHHPEFQRLEAAWRGLHYFVFQAPLSPDLKVKVLNVSKQNLHRDCTMALEFDQTALFKKIYEEEYGTLGGHPFGLLIGDYEFGLEPEDLDILETVSIIAAASQAPFLAAASPKMFGMVDFTELDRARSLARLFEIEASGRWNSLRERETARYLGLVLPRMLMRLPYGVNAQLAESFLYDEGVDGTDHGKYLWGNAAYALGARITNAFAKHGWCAAIRGLEGGGLVEKLPAHTFFTDDGDVAMKCPTEIAINDQRTSELERLGFIPLLYYRGTDCAVFFPAMSCSKPRLYVSADENVDAGLRAQLSYTMAAARFTHYMRCIARDRIGSFLSREVLEELLNSWVAEYVLAHDGGDMGRRAERPLKEARVELTETADGRGRYIAALQILPSFQLQDGLTHPLRVDFMLLG